MNMNASVMDASMTHTTHAMEDLSLSTPKTQGEFDEDDSLDYHTQSRNVAEVKALVKRETRAVNLLRGIVLAVLICAAVVSAKLVYDAFTAKSYDAYEEEYEAVSTRLVELYRHDVLQKLWLAQNLAAEVTTMMTVNKWAATGVTIPSFESMVQAAVVLAPVKTVRWSPLLKTEEDFKAFQSYASHHQAEMHNDTAKDWAFFQTDHYELPSSPLWQEAPLAHIEKTSASDSEEESDDEEKEKASASNDETAVGHPAMVDLMANPIFRESLEAMLKVKGPVMSQTYLLSRSSRTNDSEDATYEDGSGSEESEDGNEDEQHVSQAVGDHERRLDSSSDSSDDSDEPVGDGKERAMTLFYPVFDSQDHTNIVGSIGMEFAFSNYLSGYALIDSDLVREENVFDTDEVDVVLENTCGQTYTIKVDHGAFDVVGEEDLHNRDLDDLVMATSFEDFDAKFASFQVGENDFEGTLLNGHCRYRFLSYPTKDIWDEHHTDEPFLFAMIVAMIFFFTSTIFIAYDCIVSRRQQIITERAIKANSVVSSLFPEKVRNQLYKQTATPKRKLTTYMSKGSDVESPSALANLSSESAPIADLFAHCTVIFADIAGFTSWSSEREPAQVFQLLERIFGDFDQMARKVGVFKIETIGDAYMGVSGLPNPREDHAVAAARFARIISLRMQLLCKQLENSLGPSTADLRIRIGLHSGPVTAGVLRGEKSRFQLFGDTVNCASRMESTGVPGKIHVSSTTAEELRKFGFGGWLTQRQDTPLVKGKGRMQTYFLQSQGSASSSNSDLSEGDDCQDMEVFGDELQQPEPQLVLPVGRRPKVLSKKLQRLVNWNAELLARYLKPVVARRRAASAPPSTTTRPPHASSTSSTTTDISSDDSNQSPTQIMDEMVDVLALPRFDAKVAKKLAETDFDDDKSPLLTEQVLKELHDYVACIAGLYNDVPFHSFQHASHVTLSSMKLLNRIVTPEDVQARDEASEALGNEEQATFFPHFKKSRKDSKLVQYGRAVHKATYGIHSDVLMQFAIIFSALIHDVDHQGVPNLQLTKEEHPIAKRFDHKSAAEQNSIDIAFAILMQSNFDNLRKCIAPTEEDWKRFRQLIVVAVLSTDIASADLRKQRAEKWDKAFFAAAPIKAIPPSGASSVVSRATTEESESFAVEELGGVTLSDRRATAVLEQVIQASDVAHTMQHWHTFIKWNQRLFEETYRNYATGRAEKDPADGWYEGEMGFFDFYIIPLAKKLDTCGVFGVSKDEYLNFASENRKEWELKGRGIVEEIHQKCKEKYGTQVRPVQGMDDVGSQMENIWC